MELVNTVVRIVQEVWTQPLVFRVGIPFPLDEVLQQSSRNPRVQYLLDFELFFAVHDVWWRLREIFTVLFRFLI